jgi:hypothetical protein
VEVIGLGAPPLREIVIDEVTCADVRIRSERASTRMGNAAKDASAAAGDAREVM